MASIKAKSKTHVSTPGKALITGGYLVLDQRFKGLVIAIDSRFHVIVKGQEGVQSQDSVQIFVKSPQFQDGEWNYRFSIVNGILNELDSEGNRNKFVASALYFSLGFIRKSKGTRGFNSSGSLVIEILADNDFYSQLEYVK